MTEKEYDDFCPSAKRGIQKYAGLLVEVWYNIERNMKKILVVGQLQ